MNSIAKIISILLFFAIILPVQSVIAEEKEKKKKSKKRYKSCINMSSKVLNKRAAPYSNSIAKYAKRYGVDANLVKAVMAAESCYNRSARSPKNAQGLMQLIPKTAARFGVTDSYNPDQNIRGGTNYLKILNKRFKGDLVKTIAAYNAGEGAVDKYKGVPPYKETRRYVKKVMHVYAKLSGSKVPALSFANNSKFSYNKKGRVSTTYASPFAKGKPGRSGLVVNKLKAPHLYKKM